jgi:GAF domain-containing protein/DNA-binding CsgD family transcriptional regulator
VLELEDDQTLRQRAEVGWEQADLRVYRSTSTHAFETLSTGKPVVISDFETDDRFERSDRLREHDVRSSIGVVVGTADDPWGVIAIHDTAPREFTDHDARFIQSIANTLMGAIEREIHERALLQQGQQLAALNQLNTVAREINHAIARETTREEIEQLLCDRLISATSYQLAWIGRGDEEDEDLTIRTAEGVTDYLEEVTIPLDDEGQFGPAAVAIRTGETQVIRDLAASHQFEPWQDVAEKYDLQSVAIVPIQYESSLYGVFALYSDREEAFTGEELAVIDDLGKIVGHTLQSLERKRLLMTDEVVRIDLRLQQLDEVYDILEMASEDRIDFEQIVALGEGDFLAYGTSTLSPEDLAEIVDAVPHFDDVEIEDGEGDAWQFTLHLVDPPALSTIAAHGGRLNSATVEGGDYRMRIELPADVEARSVLDPIRESYPALETVAQRRVTSDHHLSTTTPTLESMLTDRQRAVLEAAYYGGYFEWPRDVSAEDLAEQMDVSPPTLHEHLRNAQRKAFAQLLDERD